MASAPIATPATLPNGTCVILHGLVSATRYNGLTGTVTRLAESSGRYGVAVMLPGSQETILALKPANISVVAAAALAADDGHTDCSPRLLANRLVGGDGADGTTDIVIGHTDAGTATSLPGELLQLVFAHCDPQTLMMTIPRVSHRWLGVCQTMRDVSINLRWAVRNREHAFYKSCRLTDTGLAALVLRFPFTTTVALERCERVTETGLQQALSAWPNLTHLELLDDRNLSDRFPLVLAGCPNLVHLNLGSCGTGFPGISNLTDAGFAAVGAARPNLTHLSLDATPLTDAGLVEITTACPHLVHFSIERCDVTEAGLANLAARCPNLEHLNLRMCHMVAGAGLNAVAKCMQIRHLDLSGEHDCPGPCVTEGGLEAVAARCPKLEHLNLSGSDRRYSDENRTDPVDFAVLARIAAKCPGLEHLNVRGCFEAGAGLAEVATECRNLKHLDLGCCEVTDADLVKITTRCPNLEHLDAIRNGVTDVGLATLAGGCPHLRHLNLHGCSALTGAGLEAIAAGCPIIQHVNLSHCYDVTDGGLKQIATECPSLRYLNLVCCSKITDHGLASIAATCPNLETLVLCGCRDVTRTGLALFPDAKILGPEVTRRLL